MYIYIKEPKGDRVYPLISETSDDDYLQKIIGDLSMLGLTSRVSLTSEVSNNQCGIDDIFRLTKLTRLLRDNPLMVFKDVNRLEYFVLNIKNTDDTLIPIKKSTVLLQDCFLLKSIEKQYNIQLFNL